MIENIPDLGTQGDISELLAERRKLTLEYITISNNFRNFSDCYPSQRKNLMNDIGMKLEKK